MIQKIIATLMAFVLGIASANIYISYAAAQKDLQTPDNNAEGGFEFNALSAVLGRNSEVYSPSDRIKENQILVGKDKVTIDIQGATWATFTDTNSMDPVIDAGSNAIEVVPASENELSVGDIVAYQSEYADGIIIHRIAYKGHDENGTYFIMKGDNNPTSDPGRIRFSQIKSVVVAVIY